MCKLLSPAALSLLPGMNDSTCCLLCPWQRSLRSIVVVIILVIAVITVATTIFLPLSRDLFDCCVLFHCHVLSCSSSIGGHPIHIIICCRRCCRRCCHCQNHCHCPHHLQPPLLPPRCCCRAVVPPPPKCRHQAAAAITPPPNCRCCCINATPSSCRR